MLRLAGRRLATDRCCNWLLADCCCWLLAGWPRWLPLMAAGNKCGCLVLQLLLAATAGWLAGWLRLLAVGCC